MKPKLITFDAFSALYDIETSITRIVEEVIGTKLSVGAPVFFRLWRKRQWDYLLLSSLLGKGYLSYHVITERALIYCGKTYNVEFTPIEIEVLLKSWSQLTAWPEAAQVLKELKEMGHEIAILSNGDTGMLEMLAEDLPVKMDYIFSAEKAQAYKPHPNIYQLPFSETTYAQEDVIHIAGSPFDTLGAKAAGMKCIWSNRFSDFVIDPSYPPDHETDDLNGISELLK